MKIDLSRSLFLFSVLILTFPFLSLAQQIGIVRGHIISTDNEPAEYVSVALQGRSYGDLTNTKGDFEIKNVKPGNYTIVISGVGYVEAKREIIVSAGMVTQADFTLTEDHQELQSVEITGRKERTYKTKALFIGNKTQIDIMDLPICIVR